MGDLSNIMGGSFKPSEVPPSEYELLPAGDYAAIIESSEVKPSRSGHMLVITFAVLSGTHDGKKVIERLNIVNQSEKTELISRQIFAKICDAIGLDNVTDTAQILNKRLKIGVEVEKGVGTFINKSGEERPCFDKNIIKRYMPLNTVSPSEKANTVQSETVAQDEGIPFDTGAKKAPPWA